MFSTIWLWLCMNCSRLCFSASICCFCISNFSLSNLQLSSFNILSFSAFSRKYSNAESAPFLTFRFFFPCSSSFRFFVSDRLSIALFRTSAAATFGYVSLNSYFFFSTCLSSHHIISFFLSIFLQEDHLAHLFLEKFHLLLFLLFLFYDT